VIGTGALISTGASMPVPFRGVRTKFS